MLLIEMIILCSVFFGLCFSGTGTDEKNLRNYISYPDEVQKRIKEIEEYRGKFKETSRFAAWVANFLIFTVFFYFWASSFAEKALCITLLVC